MRKHIGATAGIYWFLQKKCIRFLPVRILISPSTTSEVIQMIHLNSKGDGFRGVISTLAPGFGPSMLNRSTHSWIRPCSIPGCSWFMRDRVSTCSGSIEKPWKFDVWKRKLVKGNGSKFTGYLGRAVLGKKYSRKNSNFYGKKRLGP